MPIRTPQQFGIPANAQLFKVDLDMQTGGGPPPLRELEFALCGDPTPTGLEIVSIVGNNGDRLDFQPPADPVNGTLFSMENALKTTAGIFTITVNNKGPNNQPLFVGASYR